MNQTISCSSLNKTGFFIALILLLLTFNVSGETQFELARRVVIDQVEFSETPLRDALQFLVEASFQNRNQQSKGFLHPKPKVYPGTKLQEQAGGSSWAVTFKAEDITAWDAICSILSESRLRASVDEQGDIIIVLEHEANR